jgi:hypothetical protein
MSLTPQEIHELFVRVAAGDLHDSGTCVEFALAAHASLPNSKIWACDRTYFEEGEEFTTTLSHAIVCLEGVDCDAQGQEADENWAARWEDEPSYDAMNFAWYELSSQELIALSLKVGNKPPNQNLIDSLMSRFQAEIAALAISERDLAPLVS